MTTYIIKSLVGITSYTTGELLKFLINQPLISGALLCSEYGWIFPAFQGCVLVIQAAIRGYQVYTYVRGKKTYVCTLVAIPEEIELEEFQQSTDQNSDSDSEINDKERFMIIDKNMIVDYF